MNWSTLATLYMIAVLVLGLLLVDAPREYAVPLEGVFLLLAAVLFNFAIKDVGALLDMAANERERAEYLMVRAALVVAFAGAVVVLAYSLLRSLAPGLFL